MKFDYKKWAPVLAVVILAGAIYLIAQRIRGIQFSDILMQIRALPPTAVLWATAFSAAAYVLVGIYEGIALHRITGRWRMLYAMRTTVIANPVGRAIGVAVVSGGALRYRFYSAIGLNAKQVGTLIVLMAMPYLLGVGWLIDLSLLFHPQVGSNALGLATSTVLAIASIGLVKDLGWLAFVKLRRAPLTIGQLQISLPSLAHTALQITLGIAQILCNTVILYLLMPAELNMTWPAFIAIYCIAFVAGQLSNVPAGLGVLEAVLLLLLPHVPPVKLLGAVIVYRAVFEVLPLFVGLILWTFYEVGALKRRRAVRVSVDQKTKPS